MASFPNSIKSFTNPTASSKLNLPDHAQQHIDENGEIVAIETELGLTPKGAYASVRAKLDDMMALTGTQTVAGVKTFSSSPVVPLTPTATTQAASKGYVDTAITGLSAGALTFISKTTITAAATTGNIAMSFDSFYFVNFSFNNVSSTSSQFKIRFNGSVIAAYEYAYNGRGSLATMGAGSTTDSGIAIGESITNNGTHTLVGNFYLTPSPIVGNPIIYANGNASGQWLNGGTGSNAFSGFWAAGTNPTAFSIVADQNFTGTVYLYKLALA